MPKKFEDELTELLWSIFEGITGDPAGRAEVESVLSAAKVNVQEIFRAMLAGDTVAANDQLSRVARAVAALQQAKDILDC